MPWSKYGDDIRRDRTLIAVCSLVVASESYSNLSSDVWVSSSTFAFRSEKPRSLSWSPDASIFAVAVGPHVAVYDPITGCLRQTLTSPECQTTEHAIFIGARGRHLVAAGAKNIVLWDLIKSQGMFHDRSRTFIMANFSKFYGKLLHRLRLVESSRIREKILSPYSIALSSTRKDALKCLSSVSIRVCPLLDSRSPLAFKM